MACVCQIEVSFGSPSPNDSELAVFIPHSLRACLTRVFFFGGPSLSSLSAAPSSLPSCERVGAPSPSEDVVSIVFDRTPAPEISTAAERISRSIDSGRATPFSFSLESARWCFEVEVEEGRGWGSVEPVLYSTRREVSPVSNRYSSVLSPRAREWRLAFESETSAFCAPEALDPFSVHNLIRLPPSVVGNVVAVLVLGRFN